MYKRFAVILYAAAVSAALPGVAQAQFPPAPGTGPGLPETVEAIEIASHPKADSMKIMLEPVLGGGAE